MSASTESAKDALREIRDFDVNSLARIEELGTRSNFSEVVQYALKVQEYYGRLSYEVVDTLPDAEADTIIGLAEESYRKWDNIIQFDPDSGSGVGREGLIEEVKQDYNSIFSSLLPLTNYCSSVLVDVQQLETIWRKKIEEFDATNEAHISRMGESETRVSEMVENIRVASAEVGVSQQAIYYKDEGDYHNNWAWIWSGITLFSIIVLVSYCGMLLLKPDWFAPNGDDIRYDIQFIVGKVLLFGVLSYVVYLSARNFLSHRHNAIVNRQRQNALLTFEALVQASGNEESRDIILNHAAACIFSPQSTGYTKSDGQLSNVDPSVVGLISKIVKGVT